MNDCDKPNFCWHTTLTCLLVLLCFSVVASAQEYGFDVWTTANGLPQNTVTGVVQTPDGYLWLSTFDGLARFDGVRFTIFDKGNTKGIVNNRFARLFADRAGTVYAVTENYVVTVFRNGVFNSYADFATPGEPIATITSDAKGNALLETGKGFYALQGDRFALTADLKDPNVKQIYWGKSGAQWVIEQTRITRHQDGQITSYPVQLTQEERGASNNLAPYEDSRGALWVQRRARDFELWRLQDGKLTVFTKKEIPALEELFPNQVKEDADGSIWFLLSSLSVPKPNQFVRCKDNQFTSYKLNEAVGATASLIDREGNFWLASSTGLRRLRRKLITTLSTKDGLNSNEVYPLIQTQNGDIFIGTTLGVNHYADGKILDLRLTYATGVPLYLRGLWEDTQARVWLGFQGEGGFGRFEAPSSVKRIGKNDLPNGVTDFNSDAAGNIWMATEESLFKYKDDQEIAHYTTNDGLPHNAVITIHFDRNGNLWAGTYEGLAQFKDSRFISFNAEAGSPKGFVRAIYEDADGVLWFGTYGDGLVRYKDGKFFNYRVEHGLFNNGVFAILEDKRNNFWMSSNRGLHRVSKQELNDFAEGKILKLNSVSYDEKDGMLNAECNGGRLPAALKAKDGKFWFPTMGGVAIVDPEAEKVNPNPPPVVIENITIDRKPVDSEFFQSAVHNPQSAITLQPGQSNIAIEYTGLSLTKSEQVKFKYKLEGLEENWVEAGTRRTVDYSYLPAGSYTFRLIAANANGVWNNEGTALRIIVRPFFYQTWWFLGLLAMAVAGLVGLVYHTRISRLRAIAEAKTLFSRRLIESQEAERKRIASELHDGLGQNLVVIKNRAALGIKKGDDKERVAKEFNNISESATQALDEVREITNNLRPQLLDRLGLTKAITAMLKKVSDVVEIESEIDSIDNLFNESEEISVYRIIQESLNNVIKHANAANAIVKIKRTENQILITIEDNGKGFDTSNIKSGLGLVGLKERAQLLNAALLIESKIGKGTAIQVEIRLS